MPIFTLVSESVFARVSPGWLLDEPASAGRKISGGALLLGWLTEASVRWLTPSSPFSADIMGDY